MLPARLKRLAERDAIQTRLRGVRCVPWAFAELILLEAAIGIEPMNKGFAVSPGSSL